MSVGHGLGRPAPGKVNTGRLVLIIRVFLLTALVGSLLMAVSQKKCTFSTIAIILFVRTLNICFLARTKTIFEIRWQKVDGEGDVKSLPQAFVLTVARRLV